MTQPLNRMRQNEKNRHKNRACKRAFNHPDRSFVSFLCDGLRHGLKIGYEGSRHPVLSSNLISANQHPEIIECNLFDEVVQGHTAEHFNNPPFENFQIYPISLVPKKHSQKMRTIFHLSYPKGSAQENYSLQYIRLDDAIKIIN